MPQNWKTPHGSMNFGSLKFAKVQPSNIAQPRIQCDCTIEPQLQQLHAKQCHCNVETLCGTNKNMWRMCHHWKHNAVDGRNPTPVDRQFIPLFTGFYLSQVVQDFFHQQYLFGSSAIISLFPLDCTDWDPRPLSGLGVLPITPKELGLQEMRIGKRSKYGFGFHHLFAHLL